MISATVEVYSQPKTVGEVREWLAECEKVGMSDTTPLQDGMLYATYGTTEITEIECWDHVPKPTGDGEFWMPKDLLIALHPHIDHTDESRPE